MYLIDTDVLIWVLRGNKRYVDFLQILKEDNSLFISSITVAEIYKNIFPSEMIKTENILNEFLNLDITAQISKQAGLYWQQYSKKLKGLSLTDCLIAATTSNNDLILVTLNAKHFPMKDIQILNPGHK